MNPVRKKGFTLTEVLVVVTLFLLILGAVYSVYLLSERAFREGETASELAQNGRAALERITREIRQARALVTELSIDISQAAPAIEFEDGNISERYHYIRYFMDNSEVKREVKRYYFSGNPDTFVAFNATPPQGEELLSTTAQEAQVIGEFIQELKFWSSEIATVNVFISLQEKGKQVDFASIIFGRNL